MDFLSPFSSNAIFKPCHHPGQSLKPPPPLPCLGSHPSLLGGRPHPCRRQGSRLSLVVAVSREQEEAGRRWGTAGRGVDYYKRVTGEGRWGNHKKETQCLQEKPVISPKYGPRNCTPDSPLCIHCRRTISLHCSLCVICVLSPADGLVSSIHAFAPIWPPKCPFCKSWPLFSILFIFPHLACSRLFISLLCIQNLGPQSIALT